MYRLTLTSIFLVIVLACNTSGSTIDPNSRSIQQAQNAYFAMDHQTAYSIFTNVWKDAAQTLDDRHLSGMYLAKMNWLFYGKNNRAFEFLDSLAQLRHNQVQVFLLKARILGDEMRWDEAIATADLAIQQSQSEKEKLRSTLAYCSHIYNKEKERLMAGKTETTADSPELQHGYSILQDLEKDNTGDVEFAKLFLGYSLLLKQGPQAFKSWMSYYRLTHINQVHKSLLVSPVSFKNSLDRFKQGPVDESDVGIIIKSLAESGFYELAVLVNTLQHGLQANGDKGIGELISYYGFLKRIDKITKEFYRQTLADTENKNNYKKAIRTEAQMVWDQLSWNGNPPPFSESLFEREIRKRFKSVLKFLDANGYFGLHMGHVVLDDKRLISQYKESAEFRYVAIDHMVSNGYSGWFWDGQAETGGWANDDDSFLQVRSAYTSGPIRSWQAVTDSIEILKTLKKIRELSFQDDSLAAKDPYGYLPGLSERINYHEKKELLDSLRTKDLEGSALRLNFINLLERIVLESSIYAHEGRHAIDKKNNYASRSEELEYRAKLSEIYFSRKPMLAFGAILSRNLGDGTTHGNANLRVIQGLVEWIESNSHNIAGYEWSRPALPQIDKLTDHQLKTAIKELDPMAK